MHVLVLQCQKTVLVLAHDISWSVDAEHIAVAQVGIPKEILTDQGTNFTSQLLAEL